MNKRNLAWTLGGIAVLGCAFAAGGYFLGTPTDNAKTPDTEEVRQHSTSTIFNSEMLNDEKTMIAAIAWYGYEQKKEPQWYAWKNSHQVDYMDLSHIKMYPQLSITGDKHYYQFQPNKSEKTICGFVASKDRQMFYLYAYRDDEKKVKPLITVKRSVLLKELNDQKVRPDIENYAKNIQMTTVKAQKVTKVVQEKKRRVLDESDLWSDDQNNDLLTMMTEWGEAHNEKYAEVLLNHDKNQVEFPQATITNHLKNDQDVLLSIDSQFAKVNTSLEKSNDDDYHIVAAYNGADEKNSNRCYLFTIHNGQPEVLVSNLDNAIGSPNGKPAANFVPSDDDTLQANFAKIVEDKKKDKKEDSSEVEVEEVEVDSSDDTSESHSEDENTSSTSSSTEDSTTNSTTSEKKSSRKKVMTNESLEKDLKTPDSVETISPDEEVKVTTEVEEVANSKTDHTTSQED